MDKDKLRKADIFSGGVIFLSGVFIISQALKMPMKDSWGGVQNVWYVSPAIFPLFVGTMIMLLGGLLIRTAIKEVGLESVRDVFSFVRSPEFARFLKLDENLRFYAIVTILISFVFIFIPRVDFFLTAIEFLTVFILIFYMDNLVFLRRMFGIYLVQVAVYLLFLIQPVQSFFSSFTEYPGDYLMLVFILSFAVLARQSCKTDPEMKRKYRTGIIVAVSAPLLIGIVFKYFLLVPMPFEGMVIELADLVWYMEF